jgi:uncharacterized protein DUF4349
MYPPSGRVCMNRADATSPSEQPTCRRRYGSRGLQRPPATQAQSADPSTMRPSTTRHPKIPAARRGFTPRTAAAVVGVSTIGLLAISCERDGAPRANAVADTQATAFATPPAPASAIDGRNESAAGIMARRVLDEPFNKVAGMKQVPVPAAPSAPVPESSTSAEAALRSGMPPAAAASTMPAMIVRTGTAGIEVDSLDTAIARVRTLALRVNGYIANTTVQGGKDQLRSAALEVKIPSERFDDALAGLSPIGKVESVNVNAEDVGEEYVDIEARVQNAHRLEARIIDLLANRTGRLQDVLSVEHELARVREEIERYEGRMRFLRTRAAMSTLTIAVHEHAPIIVPVAGDGPIHLAFREAWRSFVGLVAGFIASLGILIPLGVLAFLGWLGVRRWVLPLYHPTPRPTNAVEVSGD